MAKSNNNNNNNAQNKSSTAVANSASVTDHHQKTALIEKSAAKSQNAVKERDQIQSQLNKQLQQRPSATDLKNRNILKDTTASPALQAAQSELQRLQLESNLDKKLSNRPAPEKLVKQNILKADPSHGTITKQSSAVSNAKTTKSAANVKKADTINNKQLILHDKKDLQLIVHDNKDYQMVLHDTSKMQVILSPQQKHVDRFTAAYVNNGNLASDQIDSKVMIDPTTGSPMSHAKQRKYRKLQKLRDMMIDHQHSHIPVPVSNAGILYDPMQSHKMNALVKSSASVPKATASKTTVKTATDTKQSAASIKQQSASAVVVKQAEKKESSRSNSPARSVSPAPSSKTSVTEYKGAVANKQTASKQAPASPQQQSLKSVASPIITSKSASGIRVKA